MTNKPMLSVEREVIEKALRDALTIRFDTDSHVTKLRSLLDKPEDKICSVCNGFGRYQDGDSGTDEDGRCPNIVDCDCGDSERIPEYRAKPAARNQGEPVAYWFVGDIGGYGFLYTTPDKDGINLYAEQPAPVAVVMPERMDPRDPYDSEANQWNACLDEVARLNGVKP